MRISEIKNKIEIILDNNKANNIVFADMLSKKMSAKLIIPIINPKI